jgi:uncharacterized membrane protein
LRGTAFVIVVLGLLLAVASLVAYWSWQELAEVEIGLHGYLALGLGAGFTILLWVGLMSLVFFSSRRGYDDEAGRD